MLIDRKYISSRRSQISVSGFLSSKWLRQSYLLLFLLCVAQLSSPAQAYPDPVPSVSVRPFDPSERQALLEDPAYGYNREVLARRRAAAAGAQNRAEKSISEFFLEDRVKGLSIAEIVLYILGIFGFLFFLLTFLNVDIRGIFVKRSQEIAVNLEDLGGDIKALDFDGLIDQAKKQGEYRKAVRLTYLETLKILTEADYIRWKINKTNQDYLLELRLSRFRDEFSRLTLNYEYVWYGDYEIDEAGFNAMEKTFRDFQEKVKS